VSAPPTVGESGETPENPSEALEQLQVAAAVEAEVSEEHAFGRTGRPLNRRSPFFVALAASLGVLVAAAVAWGAYSVRHILVLAGLALFIALGLDPIVVALQRRGLPRGAAVVAVVGGVVLLLAGVLALAVPVAVTQVNHLVTRLPRYEATLDSGHSLLGRLNNQYHVVPRLRAYLLGGGGAGVVGAGRAVAGGVLSGLVVVVLSIYLLADLPRVKRTIYGLVPRSRRARAVLLGEEVSAKVGGYVLGNVAVSVIAGLGTLAWALGFGLPYPFLLAILVAVFDLVPLVGSIVGGAVVALVALTVSLPVALATLGFYLIFRLLEDYLLIPRVMRTTVQVPGLVTVLATIVGGTLLGIVGALVAIPVAAAVRLVIAEVVSPSLERM
jgi:predicted PurR-regulated permease PerM